MLLSHLASKPYGQSRIFQREKENLYCGKRSSKPRPGDTIVLRTLLLFSDKNISKKGSCKIAGTSTCWNQCCYNMFQLKIADFVTRLKKKKKSEVDFPLLVARSFEIQVISKFMLQLYICMPNPS